MKLRDHPLMNYRGMANWPPLWCHTGKPNLRGEIGVLTSADSDRTGNRCYLSIEFQDERYFGTLLFDDRSFCWFISKILKNRIGLSTQEIGDLDLSFTL
jgi:hypothetical protein